MRIRWTRRGFEHSLALQMKTGRTFVAADQLSPHETGVAQVVVKSSPRSPVG